MEQREQARAALATSEAARAQLSETAAERDALRAELQSAKTAATAALAAAQAAEARLTETAAQRDDLLSRITAMQQEFDAKLQEIVTHLASDHEADLGQALAEKEEARAEVRGLTAKLGRAQQSLEDTMRLLAETRVAAQGEIDRLRAQLRPAGVGAPQPLARVLIVHPDAVLRTNAKASLERAGYAVAVAADGLEALRMANAQGPDLVIADVVMPKMGGRELCQLLKSQEKTAGIKVILLRRESDTVGADGELAADDVLRKPVPFDVLRNAMQSLLVSGTRLSS